MAYNSISVFDVITIGDSDEARDLEVAGREGVVLGVSEDAGSGERWFVVRVADMPAMMLPAADLTPTGRVVAKDDIYTGEHLRVTHQGSIPDEAN